MFFTFSCGFSRSCALPFPPAGAQSRPGIGRCALQEAAWSMKSATHTKRQTAQTDNPCMASTLGWLNRVKLVVKLFIWSIQSQTLCSQAFPDPSKPGLVRAPIWVPLLNGGSRPRVAGSFPAHTASVNITISRHSSTVTDLPRHGFVIRILKEMQHITHEDVSGLLCASIVPSRMVCWVSRVGAE